MTKGLRKYLKQLPYFLLYNYPQKLKTYLKICEQNKNLPDDKKIKLNAFHSPSPMNELCEYICSWEKKNILWNNNIQGLVDTRCVIINNDLDLNDKYIMRKCRRIINNYAKDIKAHIENQTSADNVTMDEIVKQYKQMLMNELQIDEELLANYVIKTSYNSMSISKAFAWAGYGDYIIDNLKKNTNQQRHMSIKEVPYATKDTYEYLGKYYDFKAGD